MVAWTGRLTEIEVQKNRWMWDALCRSNGCEPLCPREPFCLLKMTPGEVLNISLYRLPEARSEWSLLVRCLGCGGSNSGDQVTCLSRAAKGAMRSGLDLSQSGPGASITATMLCHLPAPARTLPHSVPPASDARGSPGCLWGVSGACMWSLCRNASSVRPHHLSKSPLPS